MRKLFLILLLFVSIILAVIITFNTFMLVSKQTQVAPISPETMDENALSQRLIEAIRIQTTSASTPEDFDKFWRTIVKNYPELHNHKDISRQFVQKSTVLYKWLGSNPESKPILVVANFDAPEPKLEEIPQWTYNPFVGKIEDGKIWGAGSLSGKSNTLAWLENIEQLLKEGFQPKHSIYLVFTHNQYQEKGTKGAQTVAHIFREQNIDFELILGTNNGLLEQGLLGTTKPVGMIGLSVYNPIRYTLQAKNQTDLAKALELLKNNKLENPKKGSILQSTHAYLIPELSFGQKAIFANTWMPGFGSMATSSIKEDSILSSFATKITTDSIRKHTNTKFSTEIKIQLDPNKNTEELLKWIEQTISSTEVQVIEQKLHYKQMNIAPVQSKYYALLETCSKQIHNDLLTVPVVGLSRSDAYFFQDLSQNTYYFSPLPYRNSFMDAHISIQNYVRLIHFYKQWIRNFR